MKLSIYTLILYSIFIGVLQTTAQNTSKLLHAIRVQKAPRIDGIADDTQWQQTEGVSGFKMFEPGNGTPLPDEFKTTVKLLYNDAGIYILALMNDPYPDKISSIFGLRDQIIQADQFTVIINPLSTPNNNYFFSVYASGSQIDGNDPTGKDFSWNAVWKSKTAITKDGWTAEMFIPYSALRFQNEKSQNWSIGFFRYINRTRENYSWTYIDKTKTGDIVQFLGKLTDLENIKPPVRLSLYPYTSIIYNRYNGNSTTSFGFGMDLKYGLSENYTLDATLIPDFSDTPFDELELNLGPFEQFYKEKRQFFTEGFDLFNQAHLFYSRRIGGTPTGYYKLKSQLNNDERIVDNPDKVQLINALKISGRSKNGLGIGFFNALTNKTEAIVENLHTGKERKILTEPYANYNIMVCDYAFKNNSSISLINTNVIRQGGFRDANVTALSANLYGQKNTLKVTAVSAMSLINEDEQYTKGFKYILHASKKIKSHDFSVLIRAMDPYFDSNDMGYFRHNNYANFDIGYTYSILKPTKHFNVMHISFDAGFDHLYEKLKKVQNDFELKSFFTNKKYLSYGFGLEYVTDAYDYYEPRVPGRYYLNKAYGGMFVFLSSDYRKKFAVDIKIARFAKFNDAQHFFKIGFSPRFRFNKRFQANYQIELSKMFNDKGFIDIADEDIIFGNRQQQNLTNALGINYFFNTKSAVYLNLRYYWAPVYYDKFYKLNNDGSLTNIDFYNENHDINYNVWNMDMSYSWEFAPGSNLTLLYRNSLLNSDNQARINLHENIDNLLSQPVSHSFIFKMTYYIDYNTVKNKWF